MSDIAQAIAQAGQPQQVRMRTMQGTINVTGRMPAQLAAQRGPRILVPTGVVLPQ